MISKHRSKTQSFQNYKQFLVLVNANYLCAFIDHIPGVHERVFYENIITSMFTKSNSARVLPFLYTLHNKYFDY